MDQAISRNTGTSARLSLVAAGLLLASFLSAAGADALCFGVVKSAQYEQTLSAAPVPLASNAYAFHAFVVPSTNYAVTNASFKAPNVSANRSLSLSTNGDSLLYTEQFQTQSALDAAYPSSAGLFFPSVYVFTMLTAHDDKKSGNASYFLGATPPTPQIANLSEGQGIDTSAAFTVRWTAMGGLVGIVQLLVLDPGSNVVYISPAPLTTGALNQGSTSGTIPANTLPAGANLTGHLVFAQPGLAPDTNSYPGAVGIAAIARDTAFPLATRPPPAPPVLTVTSSNATPFQLSFSGETNRNYHVQATTNLAASVWVDLLVTNAPTASFIDTQSVSLARRFYRIQVGP